MKPEQFYESNSGSVLNWRPVVVLADEMRAPGFLVGSSEEGPTTETDDAAVVKGVLLVRLGQLLAHEADELVGLSFRVRRQILVLVWAWKSEARTRVLHGLRTQCGMKVFGSHFATCSPKFSLELFQL